LNIDIKVLFRVPTLFGNSWDVLDFSCDFSVLGKSWKISLIGLESSRK